MADIMSSDMRQAIDFIGKNKTDELAVLLSEKPYLVNERFERFGVPNVTLLHVAAAQGTDRFARIVLHHSPDVDAQDGYKRTPLHEVWHPEAAALLLKYRARADLREHMERTPTDVLRDAIKIDEKFAAKPTVKDPLVELLPPEEVKHPSAKTLEILAAQGFEYQPPPTAEEEAAIGARLEQFPAQLTQWTRDCVALIEIAGASQMQVVRVNAEQGLMPNF